MTRRQRIILAFVVAGVSIFLLFYRCGWRDLWSSHEARAAQNAASLLHYHDFRLPRLTDERPELQKPPLYYWLVAGIGAIRGQVDTWAVRLPATLAAGGCVALVGFGLWYRQRPVAAIVACLLLVTAHHFTTLGRTGRIDMPLTLAVMLTVGSWLWGGWWVLVGTLSAAAGLLLKGPIGLLLPLVVWSAWQIPRGWRRDGRSRIVAVGVSALGAVLLALPWFAVAHEMTDGEFTRVFFWYHNVQRATGGAEELAVHPWWYYGVRLLVDALPATLFLPWAVVRFARSPFRGDVEARFGLVWWVSLLLVLSLSRFKRADYLLPAYPGLAIFLGCVIERLAEHDGRIRRTIPIALGGLSAAALIGWLVYLHAIEAPAEIRRESRRFAKAIREIAPPPTPILLFRVESHPLAFHLGRPINTLLEWENLDVWAESESPIYVVMTPEVAAKWPKHLRRGRLETVLRRDHHEKPLVLLRTCRSSENVDGPSGR